MSTIIKNGANNHYYTKLDKIIQILYSFSIQNTILNLLNESVEAFNFKFIFEIGDGRVHE